MDEIVRLVHEVDTAAAVAGSRKMATEHKRAVAEMDAATKGAQREVEQLGFRMDGSAKTAIRVGKALSAGIGAATAAAAGAERSFIGLGISILSSFAAGGPVVGAIATVAGGVGLLVGQANEAEERFKALAASASTAAAQMRAAFGERGLAAEGYGLAASSLTERRLQALQGERVGLDALGAAVSGGDEKTRTEAVLNLRRRIVDEERKGTAEGREQAKHLSEQLDLLTQFSELLGTLSARLNNLNGKGQARSFTEFMQQLALPQPNDRIREASEPLMGLAQRIAQMVGIGKGANTTEQDVARDQLRVDKLMRMQAIEANRLKIHQEMEALQRAFDGEMANVVASSQRVEDIDRQIADLRKTGTEEARKQIPLLQKLREEEAARARWLLTVFNPQAGKRIVDDLIAQKTALTESAKMAQFFAEWMRTAGGYAAADVSRYEALVQAQMRLADTKDALRRSEATAGFGAQAKQIRFGAMGLPTETLALESQLVQLEARRTALAAQRGDLTAEELKDLQLQIDGTKMLLGATREAVAMKPLFEWARQGAGTIADALTEAFTRGGRDGTQALLDITRQAVNQLLSTTIRSILQSGIDAAFQGLFGGGGGGGGGFLSSVFGLATSAFGGGGGGNAFAGGQASGSTTFGGAIQAPT